jgi:hypothetical protein
LPEPKTRYKYLMNLIPLSDEMVNRDMTSIRIPGYVQLKVDTTALEKAVDKATLNGSTLEAIGKKINGFKSMDRPTSNDGYVWFWSMNFKKAAGPDSEISEIAVLFPWAQNWKKAEGLRLDRPMAVMAKGGMDSSEAQKIVDKVCAEIDAHAGAVRAIRKDDDVVERWWSGNGFAVPDSLKERNALFSAIQNRRDESVPKIDAFMNTFREALEAGGKMKFLRMEGGHDIHAFFSVVSGSGGFLDVQAYPGFSFPPYSKDDEVCLMASHYSATIPSHRVIPQAAYAPKDIKDLVGKIENEIKKAEKADFIRQNSTNGD